MNILNLYTPAELSVLIKGSSFSEKHVLKYTLFDLFLKEVLNYEIKIIESKTSRKSYSISYVSSGRNIATYKALPHEKVFLGVFYKQPSISVPLNQLVRVAFERIEYSEKNLKKLIVQSPNLTNAIRKGLWWNLFGSIRLTQIGIEEKQNILAAIKKLELELPPLMEKAPERALEIIALMKGAIFLIAGIDFDHFKSLETQFGIAYNKQLSQSGNSYSGCGGGGCFSNYDSYSSGFDSSYESTSSSNGCSSSGCSSCSGCSGCGGCGGCN